MMRTSPVIGVHRHADLQRLSAPDGRQDRPQRRHQLPLRPGLRRHGVDRRQHHPAQGHASSSAIARSRTSSTSARSRSAATPSSAKRACIDIDTAMGDDTQLGHASSLQSGQRVPDGKRYHGSPAVETTSDYCPIESRECGALRTRVLCRRSSSRRCSSSRCRLPILAYHFWDQYAAASGVSLGLGTSTLSLLGISAALVLRRDGLRRSRRSTRSRACACCS